MRQSKAIDESQLKNSVSFNVNQAASENQSQLTPRKQNSVLDAPVGPPKVGNRRQSAMQIEINFNKL